MLDMQYSATVATDAARVAGQTDRTVQVMSCPDRCSHARLSERVSVVSNESCARGVLDQCASLSQRQSGTSRFRLHTQHTRAFESSQRKLVSRTTPTHCKVKH